MEKNQKRIDEINALIKAGGLTFEKEQELTMELEELESGSQKGEYKKQEPKAETPTVITPTQNAPATTTENKPAKKVLKTWQEAITALPEKYTQLKIDEKRATIECGFAVQIIQNNSALQKCEAWSVFNAIVYSARIGLTLNPAFALSYLVPRGGKCCLDIGYRGWCATLKSYGSVKHIDAYVVYEDEQSLGNFTWNPSSGQLHHVPSFAKTEDEQKKRIVYGAYAKAILMDGTDVFEFIPAWELEKIKKVSPASKGFSPYTDWAGEMTRKAPIKRIAKKLLVLQNDDRVKAMFELEKENDESEVQKKKVHGDWADVEVMG